MEIILYQDKIKAAAQVWQYQSNLFAQAARLREVYANLILNPDATDYQKVNAFAELFKEDAEIIKTLQLSNEPPVTETSAIEAIHSMLKVAAANEGCKSQQAEHDLDVLLSRRKRLARLAINQAIYDTTENFEATVTNVQALNSEIKKLLAI